MTTSTETSTSTTTTTKVIVATLIVIGIILLGMASGFIPMPKSGSGNIEQNPSINPETATGQTTIP